MIKSHEDEFIAVRVQDPRVINEGSWNSYVDFKIFLHTNSAAFTAKTSCVRRRYSEFVWLKKTLQKNAGLVPVPDLPGKSFFTFNNTDFIEKRRKGLQSFLDKVVHMTVCLSDSQLHLFLQTQLPVGHIQDCVRGHTPYSVTDAILTYASSNCGWAQEEVCGSLVACPMPIPYESIESPCPSFSTPLLGSAPNKAWTGDNELISVPLNLCKDNSDDEAPAKVLSKEKMQNGELVVEVHHQVPHLETQNTTEQAYLSIPDKRRQTHNTEESETSSDSMAQMQPAGDMPQAKHEASNNNWFDLSF